VIQGPNQSSSVAFWYLGGAPSIDGYFVQSSLSLITNSNDTSPTIGWTTDSPAKVSISPNGSSGATLTSTGHSGAGTTYDIHITVSVDGVSSTSFPVFINTPWTQSHTGPSATTCTALFGSGWTGWAGQVTNTVTDLTGTQLVPITSRETFENDKVLYAGENWGTNSEATWAPSSWTGHSFVDTYAMCWFSSGTPPTPPTVPWNPNGTTKINSDTQKYWIGSGARFSGECSQRHAITWYTDHATLGSVTTPISDQSTCAPGRGFLN
jgi:hypothetical protein